MTESMTDFRGNSYAVGDTVVYAAVSGRSVTMIEATVLKFNESGSVKLQPLNSSRWTHHNKSSWMEDARTGEKINLYGDKRHEYLVSESYYEFEDGTVGNEYHRYRDSSGRILDESEYQRKFYYHRVESGKYHPAVYHDWVVSVKSEFVKPVTISITDNIILVEKAKNA